MYHRLRKWVSLKQSGASKREAPRSNLLFHHAISTMYILFHFTSSTGPNEEKMPSNRKSKQDEMFCQDSSQRLKGILLACIDISINHILKVRHHQIDKCSFQARSRPTFVVSCFILRIYVFPQCVQDTNINDLILDDLIKIHESMKTAFMPLAEIIFIYKIFRRNLKFLSWITRRFVMHPGLGKNNIARWIIHVRTIGRSDASSIDFSHIEKRTNKKSGSLKMNSRMMWSRWVHFFPVHLLFDIYFHLSLPRIWRRIQVLFITRKKLH